MIDFDDDVMIFSQESAPDASAAALTAAPDPWKILVVDDDDGVLAITRAALAGCQFMGRPLELILANSSARARHHLRERPDIALVLLDVVMETEDAGLRLTREIREDMNRQALRIILRTGQPGMAPEREVVLRYDINDYRLKTDMTVQSLFTTVIAGLRGYHEIASRIRAEETAIMANRAKSQFLANINHELRTPLNAIIGLAELMESEVFGPIENEQYRQFLGDITRSGRDLYETLETILDVASFEIGTVVLRPEALVMAPFLERSVRTMRPLADEAGLTLRLDLPETLPLLWADPRRLRQALLGLVANGIKFSQPGGLVSVTVSPAADDHIAITIADQGIGMTARETAAALMPFSQIDGGLPGRLQGTGLGLPLAALIVERHHGRLAIESEPGQGTTVRLTLPSTLAAEARGLKV
ncbi:MAG: response regulator [Azospirillum sp.]|nr:response regulator [Azospirillum sp.]